MNCFFFNFVIHKVHKFTHKCTVWVTKQELHTQKSDDTIFSPCLWSFSSKEDSINESGMVYYLSFSKKEPNSADRQTVWIITHQQTWWLELRPELIWWLTKWKMQEDCAKPEWKTLFVCLSVCQQSSQRNACQPTN